MASTGNGATISVGGQILKVRSISGITQSVDPVETTHLATTGFKTMMAGDLKDPGSFTVEVFWQGNENEPSVQTDAAQTITLVFPAVYGGSTTSLTGTGFITSQTFPEVQNGEVMVSQITVQFDGGDDSSGSPGDEPTFA